MVPELTDAELPQGIIDTVLEINNTGAIIDLACALSIANYSADGLRICADHILDLRDEATKPFHPHLRWIFVITVRRRGFKTLEDVGKERFVKMLNHLHIDINDVWFPGNRQAWSAILLEIIQSVGGAQHLAISTGNSWQNS